ILELVSDGRFEFRFLGIVGCRQSESSAIYSHVTWVNIVFAQAVCIKISIRLCIWFSVNSLSLYTCAVLALLDLNYCTDWYEKKTHMIVVELTGFYSCL